jgi:glutaredoxin
MKAVIYSKDYCPFCTKAKTLLNQLDIPYDEHIIMPNGPDGRELTSWQSFATREELLAKAPNAKTVPQVWLDGVLIGGYTDLAAHLSNNSANAA